MQSCATLTNHHDEECEVVAIKDRIGLCAFVGISRTCMQIAQIDIQIGGPKRYCPAREGPGGAASLLTRKDSPEPPSYYGVCSFCGLVGHGHELCPELKRAVREQADQ